MTEIKQLVDIIRNLDGIKELEAEVGEWTISISDQTWRGCRKIEFTRPLEDAPTEKEMADSREAVGDD